MMLSHLHRIYFDGNDANELGYLLLYFDRSRAELAQIPGEAKEGMLVTIYMIGEFEMEATLQWDATWNCWAGRPVKGLSARTTRPGTDPHLHAPPWGHLSWLVKWP